MTFWDILWTLVTIYVFVLLIWMFIGIFADIFHRRDMSGWAKAAWLLGIVIFPLIGILAYVGTRPMTAD
jgi:hypothetical protein